MSTGFPRSRWLWLWLPLLLAPLACGQEEQRGTLMLAISTDMYIDKDVSRVDIVVQPENGPTQSSQFNLFPGLDGKFLPGTFSIVEGNTPGEFVRVRIIARKGTFARVVREAALRLPRARTAMLSMPIQWLCDGHVRQEGQLSRSNCDEGQTCIAGTCQTEAVDETTLPDYLPEDVFGGGNATGGGTCFDTVSCFEVNSEPALDVDSCVLDTEVGDDLNVAIWLPAGSDGHCTNAECWVPLDAAPQSGWSAIEGGSRVQLPTAVCEHVRDDGARVRVSRQCPTKTLSIPTCGDWTLVGTEPGDDNVLDGAPLIVTHIGLADELQTAGERLARTAASACSAITGASPPTEPTPEELTQRCDAAASLVGGVAPLDWYHVTSRCWPDAARRLACERGCDETCDPGTVLDRCESAAVAGACSGTCDSRQCLGNDVVPVDCPGACDGTCSGACDGDCIGECSAGCDATSADGAYCVGRCEGLCNGLCQGRCEGTCEGTCDGDPNQAVPECGAGAQCRGGCAGDYTSPVCHGLLTPNRCDLDAACAEDCVSIGNLGVACEPATSWLMPQAGLDEALRTALEGALAELVTVRQVEAPALLLQAQRIAEALQATATSSNEPLRSAQALARVRATSTLIEAAAGGAVDVLDAAGPPRDTPGPSTPNLDCTPRVASGTPARIDDLEDGNSQVLLDDGRDGSWHVVRDGTAEAQLSLSEPPLPEGGGANGSSQALHVSGSGFTDWGAGLSLELRRQGLPYDASTFEGIKFWARGTPSLRVVFVQQNLSTGHACTTCPSGSAECGLFYGTTLPLTADWTEFTIPWSMLGQLSTNTARPETGATPFAPDELMLIKFEAPAPERFEFWLDDVSFY